MGLLGDVADFVGDRISDVVEGVTKVFKKVGGWIKDALGNEWVQKGLLAVGIITGGIAIANGVMVGFQQASAAQGFLGKFVAGSKGFVQGVAQGLGSPMDAAGKLKDAATGVGAAPGSATVAGSPTTGTDLLAADAAKAGTGTAQDLVTQGVADAGTAVNAPGQDISLKAMLDANAPQVTDFGGMGQPQSIDTLQLGGDALAGQIAEQAVPAAEPGGWLANLKKAAASPTGQLTIANMVQGYARGAAQEKAQNRIDRQERRRRESYEGFGDSAPEIPRLSQLARMRADVGASRRDVTSRYRGGGRG